MRFQINPNSTRQKIFLFLKTFKNTNNSLLYQNFPNSPKSTIRVYKKQFLLSLSEKEKEQLNPLKPELIQAQNSNNIDSLITLFKNKSKQS